MCDYSLECVASRPAKVGDKLVSSRFLHSATRGFAGVGEPGVAVCLQPGTELAFEHDVRCDTKFSLFSVSTVGATTARFRHINENEPYKHHDALEFSNSKVVLLTHLAEGQRATVLQLPADAISETPAEATEHQETGRPLSEATEY